MTSVSVAQRPTRDLVSRTGSASFWKVLFSLFCAGPWSYGDSQLPHGAGTHVTGAPCQQCTHNKTVQELVAGPVGYSRCKRPLTEPGFKRGSLETTRVRRSNPDGTEGRLDWQGRSWSEGRLVQGYPGFSGVLRRGLGREDQARGWEA